MLYRIYTYIKYREYQTLHMDLQYQCEDKTLGFISFAFKINLVTRRAEKAQLTLKSTTMFN